MKFLPFFLLLILACSSVFALNTTEISQITNAVVPPLKNDTETLILKNDQIIADLEGFNVTQLNNISNIFEDLLEEKLVNLTCEGGFASINGTNITIENTLQLALERAISNEIDRSFLDQRSWFENTFIPSRSEVEARDVQISNLESDIVFKNSEIARLEQDLNTTKVLCNADIEKQTDDTNAMSYIALALACILVASNFEWIKKQIKREK